MIKGFNKKEDKERQIRPILARQVWLNETAASVAPCGRDLSLAVAFVEKKLTKRERADFQSHLLECRHCRQFVSSEVRLQRPVFESPALVSASRGSFFSRLKFQWVTAAASLVLAAGVMSVLVVNHGTSTRQVTIPSNGGLSAPTVAITGPHPVVPTIANQPQPPRESPVKVASNDGAPADSVRTTIDMGGLAGSGENTSIPTTNTTSPSIVAPASDVKKDSHENLFNVDGSTVNPNASTVAGMINPPASVAGDQVSTSSEYSVRVESTNFETKPVGAPGRTTELKSEQISTNLADLDQASINVPASANGFTGRNSEVVIISHALVPWTTSINHSSGRDGENFASKNTAYTPGKIAFAGKMFNQVDKVWIDQEFTSNSDLPVVKVKVKSQEGQELMAANPRLKQFFSMHKQIVVVYEGKVYMTY